MLARIVTKLPSPRVLLRPAKVTGALSTVLAVTCFFWPFYRSGDDEGNGARYKFETGVAQIPHPEKVAKGGEDTYFIAADGRSVGVFDGVGGWADEGVDSRQYALALANEAQKATDKHGIRHPASIMEYAWSRVHRDVRGSSTACILSLNGSTLSSANLGDSGFVVLDKSPADLLQISYRSKEQQHDFNYPFQLGDSDDRPSDAELHKHRVKLGTIVVVGSDGLFDNLFDDDVRRVVERSADQDLAEVARRIAHEAFMVSTSTKFKSPFAKIARAYGYAHSGGKSDDITVIVARVTSDDEDGEKRAL